MTGCRVLLIQENIHSARFIKDLLEEAGYLVDWRAAVTPTLLRSGIIPEAIVLDLHFLRLVDRDSQVNPRGGMDHDGQEDQASLRSLREHPRWKTVPTLVTVAAMHRQSRRLLSRLGADDVMTRPVQANELLLRLGALLRIPDRAGLEACTAPATSVSSATRPGSLRALAEWASTPDSAHHAETILMQSLLSLRRQVAFDVGFVCAETEPEQYAIVAQMGERSCDTALWYEPGMTYTGWLARHKLPLLVPDVEKEMRVRMLGREAGTNRSLQSFIGVPLLDDGHVVGTMEVASYRSGALGPGSMAALQLAAKVGLLTLRNAKARHELAQPRSLSASGFRQTRPAPMLCHSDAMQSLLKVASRVRESNVPILITGETGSGKEVMAHYLHGAADRCKQPFLVVDCAAIPESFQSREMFGIEKGVLEGVEAHAGRFEGAAGGTLFLDEVGHMPVSLQAKLLRVLEDRSFARIGSQRVQHFTGRVIASTSVNLKQAMDSGAFLPELYHRLALVELSMPPLRSRTEDLIPFVRLFARQFCREYDLPLPALDPKTISRMLRYAWPGNVRELKNAVERTLLLSGGEDLIWRGAPGSEDPDDLSRAHVLSLAMQHKWSVPELQMRYSLHVYEQVGRNKAQACRLLRINYRTLCNHLEAAGVAAHGLEAAPDRTSLAS